MRRTLPTLVLQGLRWERSENGGFDLPQARAGGYPSRKGTHRGCRSGPSVTTPRPNRPSAAGVLMSVIVTR